MDYRVAGKPQRCTGKLGKDDQGQDASRAIHGLSSLAGYHHRKAFCHSQNDSINDAFMPKKERRN
ncbi:MAG: hypothetical protein GY802_04720 [Gammaproteobacteria bacterium]|nr:hypothetical protein [Gammaproteobacteria bacterium]